jgi:type VI secretion system protein ImpL
MDFAVLLLEHDQAATRFQLDIEGQVIDSQQPRRTYSIKWPGPKASLVQATFDGRYSVPFIESFHGPWAWFKLLERSRMARQGDTRNVVTVSVKGLKASLQVEASTIRNPFATGEWQRFSCGS